MKYIIFLLYISFLIFTVTHGMEQITEHPDKKAHIEKEIEGLFQPKSLRDRSAEVVFKLLPQQPNVKATCELIPQELIEEYINRPVDKRKRTALYFAHTPEAFKTLIEQGVLESIAGIHSMYAQ